MREVGDEVTRSSPVDSTQFSRDRSSALYKVSTEGRVTGVYFSAPVEEVNNNLVIEGFNSIESSGSSVAVSTDDGRGNNSVIMLNENLEVQWREDLPDSFQTSRYQMTAENRVDIMATMPRAMTLFFLSERSMEWVKHHGTCTDRAASLTASLGTMGRSMSCWMVRTPLT